MFCWQIGLCFALMFLGVPFGQAADASSHWAFQPIANPAIPVVQDRAWPSA